MTTHLDIVPTLISMTNASAEQKAAITQGLHGKDFSPVLAAPAQAGHDTVRDGQLFCFNMFATLDGDFLTKASQMLKQGGPAKLKEAGLHPDMRKRGAIRGVFDGRYQFTRYFSPKQHNRPTSIEALFELNDVELFDHPWGARGHPVLSAHAALRLISIVAHGLSAGPLAAALKRGS